MTRSLNINSKTSGLGTIQAVSRSRRAARRSALKGFKSGITSILEFRAFAERGKKYEQKL